jgi:branched-subunit amino acid aminotransferase/4-amino-4-deoxychorismate lyase
MMKPGFPNYLFDDGAFHAGAGLPLTDRGFRYGMSVFETIAIRNSAPLLFDAHLVRIAESAIAANFNPPIEWRSAAQAMLSQPPIAEGVARIYITAGDCDGDVPRVAILFEELPIPTELSHTTAITVEFTPALPFGKTGNYWPHFLARPSDSGDAILCKPDGVLLGGSMSNLILLIDDELLTPRHPVRRGVVRDWVDAKKADLTRADLLKTTSAFLTNSRMGICVLTSIDGQSLDIDPRIEALWTRYRTEVLRVG